VLRATDNLSVLYSFRRCPYAIRARLALRYTGLQCELREVVLKDKPAAMLAASPKATVPVLVLDSGGAHAEVIDESLDIMLWALEQHDPDGWLAVDHAAANQLIEASDEQFKPWLDRYKYPNRYDELEPGEARQHCEFFLQALEAVLIERNFLSGERAGLPDMAIYSFVRQFAFVDIEWFRASAYRNVNEWLDLFLESELFATVMEKYPAWQPGDDRRIF
jgi:glutathione S-transferase